MVPPCPLVSPVCNFTYTDDNNDDDDDNDNNWKSRVSMDQSFLKKKDFYYIPFLNIQDLDIKLVYVSGYSSIRLHFEIKLYHLTGFSLNINLLRCGKIYYRNSD